MSPIKVWHFDIADIIQALLRYHSDSYHCSSSFAQNGTARERIHLILKPGRLQAVLITTGDSAAFQPLPANDSGHDVMLTSQNDSIETEQALVQLSTHPLKPCHWQHEDKEGLSLKSPPHIFLDPCEWFTNLYQGCDHVPLRRAHLDFYRKFTFFVVKMIAHQLTFSFWMNNVDYQYWGWMAWVFAKGMAALNLYSMYSISPLNVLLVFYEGVLAV